MTGRWRLIAGRAAPSIKLADTRDRALCDAHAKVFEEEDDPSRRSFFSEIISSIADVKFSLVPRRRARPPSARPPSSRRDR